MSDVSVSVVCTAGEQLHVRCTDGGRAAEATRPLPPAERLGDLLAQVRQANAPPAAFRALGELLGALLFAGEAGALLREALKADSARTLRLTTDAWLAEWPWELALDAQGGRAPVAEGAAMVRLAGTPAAAVAVPARGVLVVPAALGHARADALQAATRHLARKAGLDVFPADPATGPSLRRALQSGAAFVHLEAVGPDGRAELDDGQVPADRLGLGDATWLVVLGGTDESHRPALRLRELGVPLVLTNQLELRAHESAAVDRELYRALAAGASLADAVRRVRRALIKSGGEAGGVWAAPVLWSAPGREDALPAALPFPPPALRPAEALTSTVSFAAISVEPDEEAPPYPDLVGPPGHPISAPVFIHDTVRLIQAPAGEARRDEELEARKAALRALGAGAGARAKDEEGLSPDERTARLVDRLVDAISRPDLPLGPPADLDAAAAQVAQRAAVAVSSARAATRALLGARAVWLSGAGGSEAARLARALAEQVFGYHPRHVAADGGTPLAGGPREGVAGTGWLYRTAASNWRRDELDPFRADQPAPATRMRLVARRPSGRGWATYQGGWLVVLRADAGPPGERRALLDSLEAGVLEGLGPDGHVFRLPLPADFRVILTGAAPPADLPPWVPVVPVDPPLDPAVEVARWLAATEARLRPAGDAGETLVRRRMADAISAVVRFARLLTAVPDDLGAAALALAAADGGEPPAAVDEALTQTVGPRLCRLTEPGAFEALVAFCRGDQAATRGALGTAWRGGTWVRAQLALLEAAERATRRAEGGRGLRERWWAGDLRPEEIWQAIGGPALPEWPLPRLAAQLQAARLALI